MRFTKFSEQSKIRAVHGVVSSTALVSVLRPIDLWFGSLQDRMSQHEHLLAACGRQDGIREEFDSKLSSLSANPDDASWSRGDQGARTSQRSSNSQRSLP
jgi:hypothetical protein